MLAGLAARDGGPAYSIPRLCDALGRAGADVTLLSVAYEAAQAGEVTFPTYRHRSFPWDYAAAPILRGLRASAALSAGVRALAQRGTVIHDHGLWLMPNVYAGREARRAAVPLVVAPRGMLSETALAFSTWKKRAFWAAMQRTALRDAACFHATSLQEYEEIRAFGLQAPVAVVGNGIDVPELAAGAGTVPRSRVVLSLGRLHPKKGLDQLLHAWQRIEAESPDWRLRIVGPAERCHDVDLRRLVAYLGLARATIEPPVYGIAKSALLRGSDLFVLPTLNENFGLTVAEALAHGVPVISTKGAPWSGVAREGCGWWIDHGVEPLAAALRAAMSEPPDALRRRGAKGRDWMLRDFSWERVARDMIDLYRWVAKAAERPAFVRCA